ncbi:MAG: UbiX family flavin prenyltransferase [Salinivirgaceae bacterium]|jgi:4-hydroxy-3-polyprenylbenzoate decarboxylase|nr:UbiX family flavin prenyltransferase [Salinivirgaceae bacterium]
MSTSAKQHITIAISGASGAIYALRLINKLKNLTDQVAGLSVVFTQNASEIWKQELQAPLPKGDKITIYTNNNFYAPIASGSSKTNRMIIIPASMGVIGRIAHGTSDDLITRAADVMLKERRQLIVVPREAPYNLIHIRNMEALTLAGAIICPATPSFYQQPKTIEELVDSVIDRIIDLMGISHDTFRWGQ